VIIVSVSYKKYRKTLGKRAKRHPFLYYFDENGVFHSKRISKIEAFFRKFQKKKDINCPYCD